MQSYNCGRIVLTIKKLLIYIPALLSSDGCTISPCQTSLEFYNSIKGITRWDRLLQCSALLTSLHPWFSRCVVELYWTSCSREGETESTTHTVPRSVALLTLRFVEVVTRCLAFSNSLVQSDVLVKSRF